MKTDKGIDPEPDFHVAAGVGLTEQKYGPGPLVIRPTVPSVGTVFPIGPWTRTIETLIEVRCFCCCDEDGDGEYADSF